MLNVGDEVTYTKHFLQTVLGCGPTDPLWFTQGRVIRIKSSQGGPYMVIVDWRGNPDASPMVLSTNIAKVGSIAANENVRPTGSG